ncbi:MAG: 30S ribosomal protein S8 [Desulfobacteraceae bacterium A6]|nr:MAG: 30S ribosomal protein S8 [Desulfobacteraceae bacterium A6]
MAMSDPIADMLTRIRNAGKATLNSVDIPGSKLKTELAKVLKNEGFIKNYKFLKDNKQGILRVYLKYGQDRNSAIFGIQRISKPGRRTYVKSNEMKPILSGMGLAVLSTSKGVMTDKRAAKEKLGGEVLCKVW